MEIMDILLSRNWLLSLAFKMHKYNVHKTSDTSLTLSGVKCPYLFTLQKPSLVIALSERMFVLEN